MKASSNTARSRVTVSGKKRKARRKTAAPAKAGPKPAAAKKRASRSTAPGNKKSSRRYSPSASKKVGVAMHEMKRGKLRSGRSGRKVTDPRQAIAIALSEARRSGAKVPGPRRSSPKRSKAASGRARAARS